MPFPCWSSAVALVAPPVVATVAFSADLSESSVISFPDELQLKKDACWGFQISEEDNKPSSVEGNFKVKLLKFGFWASDKKACFQSGLKSMKEAAPETKSWVSDWCQQRYAEPLTDWGKRILGKKDLQKISEADREAWKLAALSECLKFIKTMTLNPAQEELQRPVIGQFVF